MGLSKDQLVTIIVSLVTGFITAFMGSALNLSVPAIGLEFQSSAVALGWVINGYILASAAMSVPFGRLADLSSRKYILVIGIVLFSLSGGAIAFTTSFKFLIIMRIIQGIGAAMIFSTNQAVLISAFPVAMRGRVLGYSIAAVYTGLTAGPVIGGLINHYLGWRFIFIFTFIIGVAIFLIAAMKLPDSNDRKGKVKIDILGNILYIATIISIMYGLSGFSTGGVAKYLIPLGIVFLIVFIYHELREENPIIQIHLFRKNRSYLLSNIAALLNYGATFALGYLLSIYLQIVKGYDSQITGVILISQPLIMAVLSPYAGRLSDKISPFRLASFGMALCALGLFLFVFLSEAYPLYLIILNLFIVGFGFAFFSSPNTNAVMACVEQKDYGVASSILATMRTVGHSFSMAVVTFIMAQKIGDIPLIDTDTTLIMSTIKIAFIVFTCLCGVGIFFSMKRKAGSNENNSLK